MRRHNSGHATRVYFAEEDLSKPNPPVAAFNAMHYDATAVGHHECNLGEEVIGKAKGESKFPWLRVNSRQTYKQGVPYFQPYVIKNVAGVRIGIVGFVTPGIPRSEIPKHCRGYQLEPIVAVAKKVIPALLANVDLPVVIMHSGLDRDPNTGRAPPDQMDNENAAWERAGQVAGINVVFYGHTHRGMPQLVVNSVLMAQAENWGELPARADVVISHARAVAG